MFPLPGKTAHWMPRRRFGSVVPIVLALLAATSVAACGGGDAGNQGQQHTGATRATNATSSSGGELIAFEQLVPGAEARDLYAVGPDGGKPRLLRSSGDYPHWSPDGSQLAFLACLNPPDCTTAFALMERSTGEIHGFSMPDPELYTPCFIWTPSGTELACAGLSDSDPMRNGVYALRAADGQGLTRITKNPGGEDFPLAFSPDGSQLLLSRMDPSRTESANQALLIAPISGGRPHRITPWGYADDVAGWSRTVTPSSSARTALCTTWAPMGRGSPRSPWRCPTGRPRRPPSMSASRRTAKASSSRWEAQRRASIWPASTAPASTGHQR